MIYLRDAEGIPAHVGMAVRMHIPGQDVWARGYIAQIGRHDWRTMALVQPYGAGEARWVDGEDLVAEAPTPAILDGVTTPWRTT